LIEQLTEYLMESIIPEAATLNYIVNTLEQDSLSMVAGQDYASDAYRILMSKAESYVEFDDFTRDLVHLLNAAFQREYGKYYSKVLLSTLAQIEKLNLAKRFATVIAQDISGLFKCNHHLPFLRMPERGHQVVAYSHAGNPIPSLRDHNNVPLQRRPRSGTHR
jgi:hypothetical protein